MIELRKMIPDADVLLAISVEELAGKVLFALRRYSEVEGKPGLELANLVGLLFTESPDYPNYPPEKHAEVKQAAHEALGWLEAQGLLVVDYEKHWPSWLISRRALTLEDDRAFAEFRAGRLLPRELLHRSLDPDVWLDFLRGNFDAAIGMAMLEVEIAVRRVGGYGDDLFGKDLFYAAFHKDKGPLIDRSRGEAEEGALRDLFAGMYARYRNPVFHRRPAGPEEVPDAVGVILMASHLLREVDRIEARIAAERTS